jgi:hypothetical protein
MTFPRLYQEHQESCLLVCDAIQSQNIITNVSEELIVSVFMVEK